MKAAWSPSQAAHTQGRTPNCTGCMGTHIYIKTHRHIGQFNSCLHCRRSEHKEEVGGYDSNRHACKA